MKIAIVEDEKTTQIYLKNLLISRGYEVQVFSRGKEFLAEAKQINFRLVVLDLNLPDMNGFDICFFLKKNPESYGNIKILMLTERSEQNDINEGLKLGADEYIKKPFDDLELLLRLEKLLEKGTSLKSDRTTYKDLLIDFNQSFFVENEIKIELTFKEKEILKLLYINSGLVLSKEKIHYEIWDEEYCYGNKNVEVYIGKLKKKSTILKNNLITYKNLGYKLL